MAYDVARFLSIDRAEAPTFTPGGRLLFLADTSGTAQVWTTDAAGAWPERLTPHERRVTVVEASPAREEFVFGMDAGGDERDQLFRYDLRDGTEHRLTDDPGTKHAWGAWGPSGDRVAYTANSRDAGAFDVYVQDREDPPGAAERVFEGDGGWLTVEAWGPSGIVLAAPRSSYDVDLFLLDPATGTRARLSDGSEARFSHPHFGPDGDWLYVVTNHGADTAYLGRVDLSGLEPPFGDGSGPSADETAVEDGAAVETVAGGGDWNVDGLAMDGDRVVYARNVDGYSELHAGRLADGGARVAETAAPSVDGVVPDLAFGPGGRYAFTLSANTRPYGVHVADFGTVTDERWTPVGTAGIPPETFRAAETVRYESFDGREIPAYWTLPAGVATGDSPDAGVPVIVDVHGGPEHQRRPWFYPTKQYFLDRGYAVLEPNVRGSSGYGREYTHLDDVDRRMDSVRDLKGAVEWLRGREAVDPDRIVAYGRSYGGFMVLAAITEYPDLWAAAVEFVGIANFVTFLENTGDWRRSHREAEYGSLTEDRELLEEISPIHRIDEVACPLFVQHGANDPRVPVEEAEQVAERAREAGVPVETLVFDDEGHHTTTRENLVEEFEAVAAFLDEHVRGL